MYFIYFCSLFPFSLLTLGFAYSLCEVYSYLRIFLFLEVGVMTRDFCLKTAFAASCKFGYVVFPFHLSQGGFLFVSLLFRGILFNLCVFVNVLVSSCH